MASRKKSTAGQSRRSTGRASGKRKAGHVAQVGDKTLRSCTVGGLPILNHLLERMNLEALLQEHLPAEDARNKVSTARAVLLLLRNVLMSREPIYGIGGWAAQHVPELLGLCEQDLPHLNDDRLGRCLDRLFDSTTPQFVLAVVRHVIQEFDVQLDELHNDSTTISFYGAYAEAAQEDKCRGQKTHAITWGFSKARRPDLKQLLYTLTISDDGGVPVYFTTESGNVVDDQTHQETWQLLRELVGRPDFLYVADCKLATTENLGYVAQRGGQFFTVLPRTRREDKDFRQRLREGVVTWEPLFKVSEEKDGELVVVDEFSGSVPETSSAEGYRLLWFHSTRKAELDATARWQRTQRAIAKLKHLQLRLGGPRTRFRQRAKLQQAVDEILKKFRVEPWLSVEIDEHEEVTYRQARRGRPSKDTPYVKRSKKRFLLCWQLDPARLSEEALTDGVFPLLSNVQEMSPEEVLRAYKRQPLIEKRFSQFKTDFEVAPVYLKSVSRIQALLCVYFLVLMVQTLLERELRRAMEREQIEGLPLYAEGRASRRPTARKLIDLFTPIQRHQLTFPDGSEEVFITELSPLQRKVLKLLKLPSNKYGR